MSERKRKGNEKEREGVVRIVRFEHSDACKLVNSRDIKERKTDQKLQKLDLTRERKERTMRENGRVRVGESEREIREENKQT